MEKDIADQVLEALKSSFDAITATLGADPQKKDTKFGPLVDQGQYERVWTYIQEGKKVSKVLTGGEEYTKGGSYIAPTIFIDPPTDAAIYREEIFGPVLCVKTFETEEEALKLANDSEYGLSGKLISSFSVYNLIIFHLGAIFTQNIGRALRVSNQVHAGTVCVNCNLMISPQVPMGGFGYEVNPDLLAEMLD